MLKIISFGFFGKLPSEYEFIQYGIVNKEILQILEESQKNYLENNSTKCICKILSYKNKNHKILITTKKSHDKSQRVHAFSVFFVIKICCRNELISYYMIVHIQKRIIKKLFECEYINDKQKDTKLQLISIIKSFLYELKILY